MKLHLKKVVSQHLFFFFLIYLLIVLLQLSHFPLHSTPSCPPPPSHSPPLQFMSMGHTCKFFGFHISYTILTLPVYFPPIVYAIYSLYLSPLSPSPTPLLITLHVIFISVILFLFYCLLSFLFFFFQIQLLIVVSLLSFYSS